MSQLSCLFVITSTVLKLDLIYWLKICSNILQMESTIIKKVKWSQFSIFCYWLTAVSIAKNCSWEFNLLNSGMTFSNFVLTCGALFVEVSIHVYVFYICVDLERCFVLQLHKNETFNELFGLTWSNVHAYVASTVILQWPPRTTKTNYSGTIDHFKFLWSKTLLFYG